MIQLFGFNTDILRQAFGNSFEEVQTHLNGMEMIIKQRGIESLGVYPFGRAIRKYLLVYVHVFANLSQNLSI